MALDGNSLAYRAFFALPEDMSNASGQTTNAVYGFATMLLNLVKEHRPDGVVVVFDRPEPTFRHEAIPEYKAQREKAPETLREQLGVIRELLDTLGITWLELAGFEGDDIIATMAERAEAEGRDILIVTGDRDSYQLVRDPHVRVLYNKRGVSDYAIYDEAGILERTGVTPAGYADYAALRGDPSDNLDGVPGVGEKTAAKLITQYGDLAGVLAHADEQTPKLKANLQEHGERVTRNARMMVLRRDVPVEFDLGALAPAPDLAAARRLFEFLEFKTMGKRLQDLVTDRGWSTRDDGGTSRPEITADVVAVAPAVVETPTANALAGLVAGQPELVVAARWTGDPGRSALAGLAVVLDAPSGRVAWVGADVATDRGVLDALCAHANVVMHDAKPVMRTLLSLGADLRGLVMDTQIAAYLVDPARPSYSIASVGLDLLGAEPSSSTESSGQFDFGGVGVLVVCVLCGGCALHRGPGTVAPRATGRYRQRVALRGRGEPVGACAGEDGAPGHRRGCRGPRRDQGQAHSGVSVPDRDDLRSRRPAVQRELHQPVARDPVRRARTDARQEDQDRLQHRRRDVGEAPRRVARVHRAPAPVPRGREAPFHLRRGTVGRGRSR